MSKRINNINMDLVQEYISQGKTISEMATAFKTSDGTVYSFLKCNKIKYSPTKRNSKPVKLGKTGEPKKDWSCEDSSSIREIEAKEIMDRLRDLGYAEVIDKLLENDDIYHQSSQDFNRAKARRILGLNERKFDELFAKLRGELDDDCN
jgi:hypothetical protein